jgi:hypothetical protein
VPEQSHAEQAHRRGRHLLASQLAYRLKQLENGAALRAAINERTAQRPMPYRKPVK